MSELEYPLARSSGIRRSRRPVGLWLLVCVTAGLLLQGAGDGAGSPEPVGRSGQAAAPTRSAAAREASSRIRLPSDRVLVASPEMLGAGQSPDIWSTPLRLRGGADADAVAADETAARDLPAEGQVGKSLTPSADLRFSHASLIDLGRGSSPEGPQGVDRISPKDLPAAAAPPGGKAAVPPVVSASVDDATAAGAGETRADGPAGSVTGSIVDAAPPRSAASAPQPATPLPRLSGRWGPAAEACSAEDKRSGYIPLTIDARGAKAGEATCRFGAMTPSGQRSWNVAASCSSGAERWKSNVKLTLVGSKLTWKSARGTQTYLRCG